MENQEKITEVPNQSEGTTNRTGAGRFNLLELFGIKPKFEAYKKKVDETVKEINNTKNSVKNALDNLKPELRILVSTHMVARGFIEEFSSDNTLCSDACLWQFEYWTNTIYERAKQAPITKFALGSTEILDNHYQVIKEVDSYLYRFAIGGIM